MSFIEIMQPPFIVGETALERAFLESEEYASWRGRSMMRFENLQMKVLEHVYKSWRAKLALPEVGLGEGVIEAIADKQERDKHKDVVGFQAYETLGVSMANVGALKRVELGDTPVGVALPPSEHEFAEPKFLGKYYNLESKTMTIPKP